MPYDPTSVIDGPSIVAAVGRGECFIDCGPDCLTARPAKKVEFDPRLPGVRCDVWSSSGKLDRSGPGAYTGRRCWAYSGAGNAMEVELDNGNVVWSINSRATEPIPQAGWFEPVMQHPEIVNPRRRVFFGVRIPRSLQLIDSRLADPFDVDARRVQREIEGDRQTMTTTQHYSDSRDILCEVENNRMLRKMRDQAARAWRRYRKAKREFERRGKPDGGGIAPRPVSIVFGNFGISLVGSRTDFYVEHYDAR